MGAFSSNQKLAGGQGTDFKRSEIRVLGQEPRADRVHDPRGTDGGAEQLPDGVSDLAGSRLWFGSSQVHLKLLSTRAGEPVAGQLDRGCDHLRR